MKANLTQAKSDIEWVNEIGSHVAAGDTLDETLAVAVSFAVDLVNCDFCFIYLREEAELVLWVLEALGPRNARARHAPPWARLSNVAEATSGANGHFDQQPGTVPGRKFLISGPPIPAKLSCPFPCWPRKS